MVAFLRATLGFEPEMIKEGEQDLPQAQDTAMHSDGYYGYSGAHYLCS